MGMTDQALKKEIPKKVLSGFFSGYSQIALFGAFSLLYWYGGKLISAVPPEPTANFEEMFIPIFCMFMMGAGLGQAANGATDAKKASQAAKRVFELIDRKSAIDFTSTEGEKLGKVEGDIKFQDVRFAYPSRPDNQVCNGYNLEVKAGQTVALVGASGSGKSTAIQLIER